MGTYKEVVLGADFFLKKDCFSFYKAKERNVFLLRNYLA